MILKFIFLLAVLSNLIFATDYKVDQSHSSVDFAVSHMVISKTKGNFDDFEGSFSLNSKGKLSNLFGLVQTVSINTRNKKRDDHLKAREFFDATTHPTMTFQSQEILQKGDKLVIQGLLTIRGITKSVTFAGKITDSITDPWGNVRRGVTLSATIDRRKFGVSWSKNLDKGGLVVGNEVIISLELEGIQIRESKKT